MIAVERQTCTEDLNPFLDSVAFHLNLRQLHIVSQTDWLCRSFEPLVRYMLHRVRVCTNH